MNQIASSVAVTITELPISKSYFKRLICSLFLMGSISVYSQLHITGENTRVSKSGILKEKSMQTTPVYATNRYSKIWIANTGRASTKAIGYKLKNNNATSIQAVETNLMNNQISAQLIEGNTKFTSFSLKLSEDMWDATNNTITIHQVKQGPNENVKPIVALQIKPHQNNLLQIVTRSGVIKNTTRQNSSEPGTSIFDIDNLSTNRWYDIIVGYKFSPSAAKGFAKVWIKKATDESFHRHGACRSAVGYKEYPKYLIKNNIGLEKSKGLGNHKVYFDEIKYGHNFTSVKTHHSSSTINRNPSAAKNTGQKNSISNSLAMNLHPNPTQKKSTLSFQMTNQETVVINLHDMTGRLVQKISKKTQIGLNSIPIDTEGLQQGQYLITLNKNSKTTQARLIVE